MSKKTRPQSKSGQSKQSKPHPYVFQQDKINFDLDIKELPWTEKQKAIIALALDKNTKALIMRGCAGSSKTLLSMYIGLKLLNDKRVSDLVLMRSAVESADSKLGFLPGDITDKFGVYLAPFNDKFTELLPREQIDKLEKTNRITVCPVNFARGLHFAVKFVCCDEFQNITRKEANLIFSRMGEFSKLIVCGDPDQSDLPYGKSSLNDVYDLFNNEESREQGIFCVELGEEDVVRSEFCKFVVKKFKQLRGATPEPPKH